MADTGAKYLQASGVEDALADAIKQVVLTQPDDPLRALGEILITKGGAAAAANSDKSVGGVDFDAVVYGAGPVGAAVALGLQQRGHRVCVREKRTERPVVIDAGESINLSLSTRGVALLEEIGAYTDLKSTLIPMVSRRFSDGSTESYREPLQSINRNLLTIKLIQAAEAAGVKFEYDTGYAPGDVDAATGSVRLGEGRHCKPRLILGCDGVHGKVCKLINPTEAERSSRASEWGYYELSIPPEATDAMSKEAFNNFHIWSGRGKWSAEFIVGLPNHDGSITLTLFALMDDMVGRYTSAEGGAGKFRAYLAEAYEGGLDELATGIEEAVAGGFQRIWLNDHQNLAGELGTFGDGPKKPTGTFVFLFGDAALGMEQFLGLAVNLGFEGAHRGFLEHWHKRGSGGTCASGGATGSGGAKGEDDALSFWRGLVRARNHLNAGAKALQQASSKNAASMRDGCDDPLGKSVRAVLEAKHGTADIDESAFESTHDWWSFCTVPLKVVEAVVEAQDETVRTIKEELKAARGGGGGADAGALSEEEKERVLALGAAAVGPLVAQRAQLAREHQAAMQTCFAES